MPQADPSREHRAQRTVARRYKSLGYEVVEHPAPDRLPDFLQGMTPDVVARSESDNVVIEVKRHASLKGSNELISLADRVSGHPDWRFELVVLSDGESDQSANSDINFASLLEKARLAIRAKLFDVGYVYLTAILVRTAQDLAVRHGMKVDRKGDRTLLGELGFNGILPDDIVEASLAAVSVRNAAAHASGDMANVSEEDVEALARLCERMWQLN